MNSKVKTRKVSCFYSGGHHIEVDLLLNLSGILNERFQNHKGAQQAQQETRQQAQQETRQQAQQETRQQAQQETRQQAQQETRQQAQQGNQSNKLNETRQQAQQETRPLKTNSIPRLHQVVETKILI